MFEAFPVTASDGKQYMPIGGDYNYGINVNSKHKKQPENSSTGWLMNLTTQLTMVVFQL